MPVRTLLAGAALVGAGFTLCGCGGGEDPTPAPTPAPPTPAPTIIEKAWSNHFDAAIAGADQGGDAALDKIMLDYDNESTIAFFNDVCEGNTGDPATKRDGYTEYKTLEEIRAFYKALFLQLGSSANLDKVGPTDGGPVVLSGDNAAANVFLTYRTNLTGEKEIKYATDSYSWQTKEGVAKLWKQNIVTTEPKRPCGDALNYVPGRDCTANQAVCDGWDNHFAAFGAGADVKNAENAGALEKIMLDYTPDSIVQVFDTRLETHSTFKTVDAIKGMFKQLFTDIDAAKGTNGIGLNVKILEVEPKFNGVFLVWESLSHPKATDTFVFNDAGKIIRQNIVVHTKIPTTVNVLV